MLKVARVVTRRSCCLIWLNMRTIKASKWTKHSKLTITLKLFASGGICRATVFRGILLGIHISRMEVSKVPSRRDKSIWAVDTSRLVTRQGIFSATPPKPFTQKSHPLGETVACWWLPAILEANSPANLDTFTVSFWIFYRLLIIR